MTKEEQILFEQKFCFTNDGNSHELKYIINIILNSMEFTNSKIKISELELRSVLLNLSINKLQKNGNSYSLNGLYYVTDGKNCENREINALIEIKRGKIHLNSIITCYSTETVKYFLSETFENDFKGNVIKNSKYNFIEGAFIEKVSEFNYNEYDDFEEYSVKCLKRNKWY